MGPKRVMWIRRYQGQCGALRPLGHQGCRLRNHNKDQPLCSGYSTLVDASMEHEACACTGRGAEARTYTPLVSRVVITLIAASFGDGLLHLGLASAHLKGGI